MEDEIKVVSTIDHKNVIKFDKKNIYAKFKTYNQSNNYDKSAMVAPPKNNIIRNSNSLVNKEILLKENANHFIFSGKIANFPFIKTVKRELVDKKRTIKYCDFKNMNKTL